MNAMSNFIYRISVLEDEEENGVHKFAYTVRCAGRWWGL